MSEINIKSMPDFIVRLHAKSGEYPEMDEFRNLHNSYWLSLGCDIHINDNVPNSTYLVAVDKDKIVGSIGIVAYTENSKMNLYLFDFYVIPEYRNKGIGQDLIDSVKEVFESKIKNRGFISLRAIPSTVSYFEKQGFVKTDKLEYGIHEKDDICFVWTPSEE